MIILILLMISADLTHTKQPFQQNMEVPNAPSCSVSVPSRSHVYLSYSLFTDTTSQIAESLPLLRHWTCLPSRCLSD